MLSLDRKSFSCSIVIPAYDEAKRISRTLEHIAAWRCEGNHDAEVIVVDDGSKDDTVRVVQDFISRYPFIRLIQHKVNRGKGRTVRDGVMEATRETVLFVDADDSTPIEDAEKLFRAIDAGAAIAMGSRWIDPALQLTPQPGYRRANGRFYNRLYRLLLGLNFKDTQLGFKAYTREAGQFLFQFQKIEGWGFDAEILYMAQKLRYSIAEIPVAYTYYAEGSKIRPYRDGARMTYELWRVKWNDWIGAYPPRNKSFEPFRLP